MPYLRPLNQYKEQYKKGAYPFSECGNVNSRPVYPIFIPRGDNNFKRVEKEFCKDARHWGDNIQVASFSEEDEADMFLDFIREHFDGAWKGNPQ